jgi:branched-chain amino acid transport system substrate-binding protein
VKLLYVKSALFSTLILFLAGCQSGPQKPAKSPEPGQGPIVTKQLPAQAKQDMLLPGQSPTIKVGLLLPLTGPQAHLGTSMLNAAQMSLFENAPDQLELISEDTQGNPEIAARAAEKVIREGASVIVGPLFSTEVTAVARVAAQSRVPVLAFSSNQNVASQNVYIMGFMPGQQISRVFSVAQSKGITNVAMLVPSNEAGNMIRTQALQAAQDTGVQLNVVEAYAPGSTDMKQQAAKIKQSGAQAILIPEGGQQLRLIISSLLVNQIDPHKMKFMGTGQWDSPEILSDTNLQGSWFAASPISLRQTFTKKYAANYGKQPPRLATLAYDTISMISLLTRSQDAQQAFSSQIMTQPRGYQGIDGIFRLNADGTVMRGLAVYEISQGQGLTVISPAPEGF